MMLKNFMKIFLLNILILSSSSSIFSQTTNFNVSQITNVNGDAVNPFITANPHWNINPEVFFEIHNDSSSNIASIYYNQAENKFSNTISITQDSCLNINPKCMHIYIDQHYIPEDFLFYQTNKNGNWEIAYKTRIDSVWSDTKYVDSSSSNETNPVLFFAGTDPSSELDSVRVLYEKAGSIYMGTYKDSSFNIEVVFHDSGNVKYSNPAGTLLYSYYNPGVKITVAAIKSIDNNRSIVYKTRTDTSAWSLEQLIAEGNKCGNLKFININGWNSLSFENTIYNRSNIFFTDERSLYKKIDSLFDTPSGSYSDLNTRDLYVYINKSLRKNSDNINLFNPHTYKYLNKDSTYVAVNETNKDRYGSTYISDTLIYTKVGNTGLTMGFPMAYSDFYYTFWEDSSSGHIQLFGMGTPLIINSIKKPISPAGFQLYQNYPNPFNPTTTIKYYIPKANFVTIKVYDVLGNEIKTLVNDFKISGNYKVEFNGSSLASGIYFYRMKAGTFSDTKKLILLK